MNMTFVTTHLPPDYHYGGVVQSGHALINEFKKRISNLNIFCVSKEPEKVKKIHSENVICSKSNVFHRWGFSFSFAWRFYKAAKKADLVVINGIFSFPVTAAGLICISLNKRYVVFLRGGLLPKAFAVKKLKKILFYTLFTKRILKNASLVQTTSDSEYNNFLKLNIKTPVVMIPNGTVIPGDADFSKGLNSNIMKMLPADGKIVLFMGRLEPIKGLDLLLNAWYDYKKNRPDSDAILIIAGPDERNYIYKLKKQAEDLGLTNNVIFTGLVKSDDKWALYKRADIFVCPSYSENFGLVIAESLACGTAVIASKSTPWDLLEKTAAGKWITPDRKELSNAIETLLSLPSQEIEQMGFRGKKFVEERFSWDVIAQKLTDIFLQVAKDQEVQIHDL